MIEKPWGRLAGVRPLKPLHKLLDEGFDYEASFNSMQKQYGISEKKFDLLWRVAAVERPVLLESSDPGLFSVYIGIPFCPTRCLYCSFPSHSLQDLGELRSLFVDTLISEITSTGSLVKSLGIQPYSIYLGGGTPTSLTASELDRVLDALHTSIPGRCRELTVEAGRPETLSGAHFEILNKHQVGRISVNPQSMHSVTLHTIGRCHSPGEVVTAVKDARLTGIPVVNMDLIVGLPGEDTSMVVETVNQVLALSPENITIHVFSRKRGSLFNENRQAFTLPDAEEATAMHTAVTSMLEPDYRPYYLYRQREILGGLENIGYSLPGTECLYNIVMIEERHNILGLGCGATSKFVSGRFPLKNMASPKDVRIYLERATQLIHSRSEELKRRLRK
jgi:oxygen-independent coproporphyrinogen III oxidase